MKVELSKDIRIKKDENYQALRSIEERISDRIRSEFANEISDIKSENEKCIILERGFHKEAKELLSNVNTKTLLKVKTQVGKDSTIVQEYVGNLQRNFKCNDGTFNFVCPDKYDGNPFTIGFSCLLSIEILND